MRTELTLQLKRDVEADAPASDVLEELIGLGGWLTRWQVEPNSEWGTATFVFADPAERDRFLRAALRVPGVCRDLHETPLSFTSIMIEASYALRRVPRAVGQP